MTAEQMVQKVLSFSSGEYQIEITAPSGATVTASKDGMTYTGTESTTTAGKYEISVPECGTYTLSVAKNTD